MSYYRLPTADKLSRSCYQQVGSGDGFAVIIQAHIEYLDIFRVVGYEYRFFESFFLKQKERFMIVISSTHREPGESKKGVK